MKSPRELQTLASALGGVPILGVLPGSPAEQVGLRYGDIVTRVNGRSTKTFADFLAAHDQSLDSLEVEIFRNGEELTFHMPIPRPSRSPGDSSRVMRRAQCALS
jgi:S1-C subfamily serine protease